jgi:prepilin-type N-terminal cleavage/methylation domain-containing protein
VKGSAVHRGFTLWELLLVVALLGVAGLLTSHLFKASMTAIQSAPRVQEQQMKLDRMVSSLRQDVWSADRMDVSGKTILLNLDGRKVQWTFDQSSASRSTEGSATGIEQWAIPFAIEAHRDGASLVLTAPDAGGETRRFISQVLLTGEPQ